MEIRPQLSGPYVSYSVRARRRRILFGLLWGIFAALLIASFVGALGLIAQRRMNPARVTVSWSQTWLSMDEARQLRDYHGANVIRVDEHVAQILRDEKWITVKRRNQR